MQSEVDEIFESCGLTVDCQRGFCEHGSSLGADRETFLAILVRFDVPARSLWAHEVWLAWAHSSRKFRFAAAENEARKAQQRRREFFCGARRDPW